MNPTPSQPSLESGVAPQELLLAEFLDAALARLERGDNGRPGPFRGPAKGLVTQGRGLLDDLARVLGAAVGLREQEAQFTSDLIALFHDTSEAARRSIPAEPASFPNPFPGEFVIRARLGRGAVGAVWLADDVNLGRPVALKEVLPAGSGPLAPRLARLREEARLLAAVEHRNVVRVFSWREAPGQAGLAIPYLVLQYVAGGSLADRVMQEGPLPWRLAARYVADVAEGLMEVHARGIVHRDVKPANLLWDPERDEVLLTDFSVAARLAEGGTAAGTPYYMPPEAFEGQAGPAQDVYGLAASLFWLVTGAVPFPGPGLRALTEQAGHGLPRPDPRCAGLPAPLEALIRAGLAAGPEARPDLSDFALTLRGTLNHLLADSLRAADHGPGPVRLIVRRRAGLTFVPVAATPSGHRPRVLRDIQLVPPEPERVDVRTGDRLRLEVEVDEPGHVTVFNVGPTGNLNLLYPARPGGPTRVEPGRPLLVAETQLTPPDGRERLVALWSREPLGLRLDELLRLATDGNVSTAHRATRDIVTVQQSVQGLSPEAWHAAVIELNHLSAEENPQ